MNHGGGGGGLFIARPAVSSVDYFNDAAAAQCFLGKKFLAAF
jgi:hypothetical protein